MYIAASVAVITFIIAFVVAGKATDYFFEEISKKNRQNQLGFDPAHAPFDFKGSISPFSERHYVTLNGGLCPKYSTIFNLMEWLNFESTEPTINDYYTEYVVEIAWKSKIEHYYDSSWEHKEEKYVKTIHIAMNLFSTEERTTEGFKNYLEFLSMVHLWNSYTERYPHILLHRAIIGSNQEENGILRRAI